MGGCGEAGGEHDGCHYGGVGGERGGESKVGGLVVSWVYEEGKNGVSGLR